MYLMQLKSYFIPMGFKSIFYTALFKARQINEVIEEALHDNEINFDYFDVNPIIFQIQDSLTLDKNKPLISLLYHLSKFSIVVEIYEGKVIVIKSDAIFKFEFEYDKYQEIKKFLVNRNEN